jgi:hypothetical protein
MEEHRRRNAAFEYLSREWIAMKKIVDLDAFHKYVEAPSGYSYHQMEVTRPFPHCVEVRIVVDKMPDPLSSPLCQEDCWRLIESYAVERETYRFTLDLRTPGGGIYAYPMCPRPLVWKGKKECKDDKDCKDGWTWPLVVEGEHNSLSGALFGLMGTIKEAKYRCFI